MELSKLTILKLPYFRNPLDTIEHACKYVREEKDEPAYATAFKFEHDIINEPVSLGMLEIDLKVYRLLPEDENKVHWEYINLWADIYNMARMEDIHAGLEQPLGFLLIEFDRYMSGKTIWHNFETFAKFLNYQR